LASPDPTGPDVSEVEEVSVVVDEEPKRLDPTEPENETSGLTNATVVAATIPDRPSEPPAAKESLDETAPGDPRELVDKPWSTRSRRKVLIATAALLVVGLIASAVAFRSQDSDSQEELVVATTVPTTQPPTTLMATTTTVAIPVNVCGDPAAIAPSYYAANPGNYATVESVTEISNDPYAWKVRFSVVNNNQFWRYENITMTCAGSPGKFTVVWGRAG
jgi:hypothetical protein